MHRLEQDERELKIDAMMQAEAQHAREQLGEIASPFEEVFTSLRRQIAQDAGEILASIKKNGFVRGKVAERSRGLLELFDLMAVQNDHELRSRLVALKNAIDPIRFEQNKNAPKRSTGEIVNILEQVQELEHQAVRDMLAGPSRFSNVEI